jgi:hypothetical protein
VIQGDGEVGAFQLAEIYSKRGGKDQTFTWLDRVHRQQDAGVTFSLTILFSIRLGPTRVR